MGSKSRAPIPSCLVLVGLIWILIVFAIVAVMNVRYSNREPFDDSDMRVSLREIPDEENAYYHIDRCAQSVNWTPEEDEVVRRMLMEDYEPSAEFIAHFIEQNHVALAAFERSLQCEAAAYSTAIPERDFTATTGLRALIKALWFQRNGEGEPSRDLRFAMDLIALGGKLKNSGAPLTPYMRAQFIQTLGYGWFADSLGKDLQFETDPLTVIGELKRYQDDSVALADAFRLDYVSNTTELTAKNLGKSDNWLASLEATKRYMADAYRSAIESAALPYSESTVKDYVADDDSSRWIRLLKPNRLEKRTADNVLSGLPDILEHIAYHRSYNSAVQVLLALKVYHMRNGELPETLDVLVPEFFAEVPKDWFDGGPIKYNRDKGIVYCVGKDLVDQGGSDPEMKWHQSEDPSWAIGFVSAGT